MRVLEIGEQRFTKVFADARGIAGASHKYYLCRKEESEGGLFSEFGMVSFQEGAINEVGVNGCHNEDLISIVIDRLQGFQESQFKCRENALAITKLEEALHWLNHRTRERERRGVEGTMKP